MTHADVKDAGILWLKEIATGKEVAFDCEYLKNDITFVPINSFFSSFTRSEDSFLSYVTPYYLKEVVVQEKDVDSPFYRSMNALADSLSEEDNPIIVEYEFK